MLESKGKLRNASLAAVMLLVVLSALGVQSLKPVTVRASSGIVIDVFTQKAPFDGKGTNQPSDMFGPQEKVILYALILLNGIPANGTLVTYDIRGPTSAPKDIEFYQTAKTNSAGIAQTEFSLAVINQTDAFGTWVAVASIQVGEKTYSDTLTFEVNYVVKLLSIRTLDENLSNRNYFGDGGYIGFEIALKNNAMAKKNATLGITVFDELNVPVNSSEIHDLIVPPGERIQYLYGNLLIPKFAVPGNATITVVALDNDHVSYCPKVSANFTITISELIFPNFIDAFVYVEAWPPLVEPGENVTINLAVTNQGTIALNDFYVSLHANTSLLNSYHISSLSPYTSQAFYSVWNTSGLPYGAYIITAEVQVFPHEADLSDNTYSCQVELTSRHPTAHDVQVANVTCSKNEVYQGEIVSIAVTIRNNGAATELTNVSVYYGNVLIEKKATPELPPATEQVITFEWNTANVPEGTHQIVGIADPVEVETNTADNIYYDGLVRIKLRLPQITHDVAITALSATPNVAEIGLPVVINTTVKNMGTTYESFDVQLYFDSFLMTVLHVDSLAPGVDRTLTFTWDTWLLMEGNYTIKGYIPPVPDEQNTANNRYEDGNVWLKIPEHPEIRIPPLTLLGWILIGTILVAAIMASLFLLLLLARLRRRRRRKPKSHLFTVVAHPHV
jgi:hypothetical protein